LEDVIASIWAAIRTMKKINKIIIYPGLRQPPNDHFTCNNQPKTGADNGGE
jgi:hypothetical protein